MVRSLNLRLPLIILAMLSSQARADDGVTSAAGKSAPGSARCLTEEPADGRVGVSPESAANGFVKNFTDLDVSYSMLSTAAQASISRERLKGVIDTIDVSWPEGQLRAVRLARIDGAANGQPGMRLVCQRWGGRSTDTFSIRQAQEQAYVRVIGRKASDEQSVIVWLERETGDWRVNGFYAVRTAIAGRDAEALFEKAKAMRGHGDMMVSGVLFDAAGWLGTWGPYFTPGIQMKYFQDSFSSGRSAQAPKFMPQAIQVGPDSFQNVRMATAGRAGDQLTLVIELMDLPWIDERTSSAQGVDFLKAFRAAHPKWSEAYDRLELRRPALKPELAYRLVIYSKGRTTEQGVVRCRAEPLAAIVFLAADCQRVS